MKTTLRNGVLIWAVSVFARTIAAKSCGLVDISEDTSPENPHILPAIPDNLAEDEQAWAGKSFGTIDGLVAAGIHAKYLAASFRSDDVYLKAKAETKDFVRTEKTRILQRGITINCVGGDVVRYFVNITLQDMDPPKFSQDQYSFTISKNWNKGRPISDGEFITVSDNNVELEDKVKKLNFQGTPDVLKVEAHPLWVLPPPGIYHYRLDIYLKDNADLQTGEHHIKLAAQDEFNSGITTIKLNVVDTPV